MLDNAKWIKEREGEVFKQNLNAAPGYIIFAHRTFSIQPSGHFQHAPAATWQQDALPIDKKRILCDRMSGQTAVLI